MSIYLSAGLSTNQIYAYARKAILLLQLNGSAVLPGHRRNIVCKRLPASPSRHRMSPLPQDLHRLSAHREETSPQIRLKLHKNGGRDGFLAHASAVYAGGVI